MDLGALLYALFVGLLIIWAVMNHEFAHAKVARLVRVTVNGVYLGFPSVGPKLAARFVGWRLPYILWIWKWWVKIPRGFQFPGVDWRTDCTIFTIPILGETVTVSWLLFGGGADIPDKEFETIPVWKTVLIALAGPVANVVFGIIPAFIVFGVDGAIYLISEVIRYTVAGLVLLVSGQLSQGDVGGPIQSAHQMGLLFGSGLPFTFTLVLVWLLINLPLAVMNMLPLPALDGGHFITSLFLPVVRLYQWGLKTLKLIRQDRDLIAAYRGLMRIFGRVTFIGLLAWMVYLTWNDLTLLMRGPIAAVVSVLLLTLFTLRYFRRKKTAVALAESTSTT